MLARCLSLEFSSKGPPWAFLRGIRDFTFALRVRSLVFIFAPFPVLPLVNTG